MQRRLGCFGLPKTQADEIIFKGDNGKGSTNGNIRCFTAPYLYSGSSIKWISDAVLGDSFMVTASGIYAVNFQYSEAATSIAYGISLNATTLNAGTGSNAGAFLDSQTSSSGTIVAATHFVGWLNCGDVIRCHGDGAWGGANTAPSTRVYFRMTRLDF